MPVDFRASQLQTNKIIASGSTGTGTNALLLIYPISKQNTSSLNQGFINLAAFNTSSIGSDVFMYVSGGIAQKGVSASNSISVFGGDLHVSGNLSVNGSLPFATSSFFRLGLVDYASTISTSSSPEVVGQVIFSANEFSGTLTLRGMLSSTSTTTTASVKFWNLTSGTYVDIAGTGQTTLSVIGLVPVLTSSVNLIGANGFSTSSQHVYELQLFTSTGSATAYAGGWELRPSGTFAALTLSYSTSSTTFTSGSWIEGSPSPRLRTTASVALHTSFAEEMGADVFFFVSGSIASGSATSRNTVFGGTLITSGNLGFRNPAVPPGRGSISLNPQGSLTFFDGDNPQGWSLTQLAVSGAAGAGTGFPELQMVAAAVTLASTASTMVGQFQYNPTEFDTTPTNARLRTIFAVTSPPQTASLRLYNLTSASYVHIGGAGLIDIFSTASNPTFITSSNLVGATNFSTASALYEVQISSSLSGSAIIHGNTIFFLDA